MENWFDKYLVFDEEFNCHYWFDKEREWHCYNNVIIDHFKTLGSKEEYDEEHAWQEKWKEELGLIIKEELDRQVIEELLKIHKEGT